MDYLEEEYYKKMVYAGIPAEKARMLARLAAQLERNTSLWNRIKNEGFSGFCRWVEIQCKDIYYKIKDALGAVWAFLTSWI